MKAGIREGELWPLAKDEKGYPCEVPLPTERVARYLNRLPPPKRERTMARLTAAGYLAPCPIIPRILFADDLRAIPDGVVAAAMTGWRRRRLEEQEQESHDEELARADLVTRDPVPGSYVDVDVDMDDA
jgi:hypothetical protein